MKTKRKKDLQGPRPVKKQYDSCCLILISSFGIGLLITVLLSIPIGLVIGETSILANSIISLGSAVISIFILSFKNGYNNYNFQWNHLFIETLLTFITQLLLVMVFGHTAWFSGPTIFWARFIFNTIHSDLIGSVESNEIVENYRWVFMIIAYWFIYTPLIILGKCLGRKKHKKDFSKSE